MGGYLKEILDFVWAVINNWAGYTTGGVIVALLWLWTTVKQVPVSRKFGIFVAFIFLFFAIFNAWRDQYHARLEAEKKLETSSPHLTGSIDQLIGGPWANGPTEESKILGLFVNMTIKNTGSPSVEEGYHLLITYGGKTSEFIPQYVPDGFAVHTPDGSTTTLNRADMIYEKTVHPIERGALQRGWIRYSLPPAFMPIINDIADNGNGSIKIQFQDVSEKQYLTEFKKVGSKGMDTYMPGTQPFLRAPAQQQQETKEK